MFAPLLHGSRLAIHAHEPKPPLSQSAGQVLNGAKLMSSMQAGDMQTGMAERIVGQTGRGSQKRCAAQTPHSVQMLH